MTNAKTEFLYTTKGNTIIGASISICLSYDDDDNILLNPGYTQEEYVKFLDLIDVDYDSGYGTQHLYGIIFCENGVWYDRYEYDGSECWQGHAYPDMRNTFEDKYVTTYERSKKLERINKQLKKEKYEN